MAGAQRGVRGAMRERFVDASRVLEGVGQVVMRRDIVRCERQCTFVERNRRRDAALTAIA